MNLRGAARLAPGRSRATRGGFGLAVRVPVEPPEKFAVVGGETGVTDVARQALGWSGGLGGLGRLVCPLGRGQQCDDEPHDGEPADDENANHCHRAHGPVNLSAAA